jgi:hypothetical protein
MTTITMSRLWPGPGAVLREAASRQRTLTLLALLMLLAMLPTALALGLDERLIRGVNVWVKPLKFMASMALFSFSTAWFIGLLPESKRHARAVRFIVGSIVGAGVFEVAYITWQAALGQASHYNDSDIPHMLMYQAMGAGALLLCVTQGVLAVQISRHGHGDADPAWRLAVVRGLWLTLVLGAGAGAVLGGVQAPAGIGLPVTGWHAAADLRPAHFLGMHAQQFLPLLGLMLSGWPAARARRALNAGTTVYALLWLALMAMGLHGAHPTSLPADKPLSMAATSA